VHGAPGIDDFGDIGDEGMDFFTALDKQDKEFQQKLNSSAFPGPVHQQLVPERATKHDPAHTGNSDVTSKSKDATSAVMGASAPSSHDDEDPFDDWTDTVVPNVQSFMAAFSAVAGAGSVHATTAAAASVDFSGFDDDTFSTSASVEGRSVSFPASIPATTPASGYVPAPAFSAATDMQSQPVEGSKTNTDFKDMDDFSSFDDMQSGESQTSQHSSGTTSASASASASSSLSFEGTTDEWGAEAFDDTASSSASSTSTAFSSNTKSKKASKFKKSKGTKNIDFDDVVFDEVAPAQAPAASAAVNDNRSSNANNNAPAHVAVQNEPINTDDDFEFNF
jgi:hypothetical protein